MTTRFGRVAVFGFGLIGGSVALAARARKLADHIIAVDRAEALSTIASADVADSVVDASDAAACGVAFEGADLVVLATPVRSIEATVGSVVSQAACVTDCGSTKRAIVDAARRASHADRFVPGHPMAGRREGGLENASADLFEGRPWILCPGTATPTVLDRVEAFVRDLGARPHRMSAEAHDRAVAITSHAPQLLASALSVLAVERDAGPAAGPAFESATRVAGGGEAMWRDILGTNADEVARALRDLGRELDRVAAGLESEPANLDAALALLDRARSVRR